VDKIIQTLEAQTITSNKSLQLVVDTLCWNNESPKRDIKEIVLPEIGSFKDGDWIESKDQSSQGIRLLQLADIGEGDFLNKSDRYISKETFNRLNCTEVITGDLLISRMADPIGRSCLIPDLDMRIIAAVDCTIVRIDLQKHDPFFWLQLTNSSHWRQLVISKAGGSTRQRISRKSLEHIQIPLPSLDYQIEASEAMRNLQRVVEETKSHINKSKSLLSTLTNSFLTGGD
jgi:type I restriction enzyme S subunit